MICFLILSISICVFLLIGCFKKTPDFSFMSRNYTTVLKGLSILTVVWAHSGSKLGIEGIQFIAGTGVSIFLICSGFGLECSYQKNGLKSFWKKRVLGVAVPFWISELLGLLIVGRFTIEKYST